MEAAEWLFPVYDLFPFPLAFYGIHTFFLQGSLTAWDFKQSDFVSNFLKMSPPTINWIATRFLSPARPGVKHLLFIFPPVLASDPDSSNESAGYSTPWFWRSVPAGAQTVCSIEWALSEASILPVELYGRIFIDF